MEHLQVLTEAFAVAYVQLPVKILNLADAVVAVYSTQYVLQLLAWHTPCIIFSSHYKSHRIICSV
jgi:hypothetical protein